MLRLRAEMTTNRDSIRSTSIEFSILQRVLKGYGAHTEPFSTDRGGLFWQYNGLGGIWPLVSLVFRLGRMMLVPLGPQIPSGCRRHFTVTSLIAEFELTIEDVFMWRYV